VIERSIMKKVDYNNNYLYFIRQSPFVLISKLLFIEIIIFSIYNLMRLPKILFFDDLSANVIWQLSIGSYWGFFILSLIQILGIVMVSLQWSNEYYILKNNELLHRRGTFNLKEETFSLKNVQALTVNQTFLGKLFNYGSISFFSPVLKQEHHISNISNPVDFKNAIDGNMTEVYNYGSVRNNELIVPIRNR